MNKKILTLLCCLGILFLLVGCGNEDKKTKIKNKQATQETEIEKDTGTKKVTFIELGSVKCIPCKQMQPIMEEIEREYGDQVKVVFYDVWTEQGKPYAQKYRIMVIPTQAFLDEKGNEYFRHEGFFPKEELVKVLKEKGVD